MHFILTTDWHLRERTPQAYIGDYFSDQEDAVDFVLQKAEDYDAPILNAGDVFHTTPSTHFIVQWIISKLKERKVEMLCVFGQHDLLHHSLKSTDRTGLAVLSAAGAVELLDADYYSFYPSSNKEVQLYGVNWSEEIPRLARPKKNQKTNARRILVAHTMVVDEKLWSSQFDYTYGKAMLRKLQEYDLIVTGDNHKRFYFSDGNRYLVNCGSLMRTTAAQFAHKPCIGLYDTETRTLEMVDVPCPPADEVLSREHLDEVEERNERLEAFITSLKDDYEIDLDFEGNLEKFFSANEVREEVQELIWGNMK